MRHIAKCQMLPSGFAESESKLFRSMSPGDHLEDWTGITEYSIERRSRTRSRHPKFPELKNKYSPGGNKTVELHEDNRPKTSQTTDTLTRNLQLKSDDIQLSSIPSDRAGRCEGSQFAVHSAHSSRRSLTRDTLFGRGSHHSNSANINPKSTQSRRKLTYSPVISTDIVARNYFQLVLELMARPPAVTQSSILKGLVIFMAVCDSDSLLVADQTVKRLEYMVKHGATLAPIYDPEILTHIVTDLGKKREIATALGVGNCDIVPGDIRIVRWKWVTDSINDGKLADQLKAERYPTRAYQSSKIPSELKERGKEDREEISTLCSNLSDPILGSSCRISGPFDMRATTSKISQDPLASFYEQAAYGADDAEESTSESESCVPECVSISDTPATSSRLKKKGYVCQNVSRVYESHNDDIVLKLEELLRIHEGNMHLDDRWKVLGYRKAIASLRRCPRRITSVDEARRLPGVGSKTLLKISEIIETGELQRLRYERSEEGRVRTILTGIYGVGSKTATLWYQKGIRSLGDVHSRKGGITLTKSQEVGLEYYDDLQSRMPRGEAAAIFEMIKRVALKIDSALWVEIMGSYRRGSLDCGDLDILITRPTHDGRTHQGILERILLQLREEGIITHALGEPENCEGLEAKFMGLCRVEPGARTRRIDILTVPIECWGASLIYFTGDDIFNRSMRLLARHKGLSLNQRGLWQGVTRDPNTNKKLTEGKLVASTEEDIFRRLGVPWQLPHERIRSK